MFELNNFMKTVVGAMFAHRVLYGALAVCHASGCVVTEKPELYGPMAILYGLLLVRS